MSKPGDVIRLRKWRCYFEGKGWAEYEAPPGYVMIAVILGAEPQPITNATQRLDITKAMNALGWVEEQRT